MQTRAQRHGGDSEEDETRPPARSEESKATTDKVVNDTDDLLNEIDDLLPETEEEVETFVREYVQSGGQ